MNKVVPLVLVGVFVMSWTILHAGDPPSRSHKTVWSLEFNAKSTPKAEAECGCEFADASGSCDKSADSSAKSCCQGSAACSQHPSLCTAILGCCQNGKASSHVAAKCANGEKCCANGEKCCANGEKCCANGEKCCANGEKCGSNGEKCMASGEKCSDCGASCSCEEGSTCSPQCLQKHGMTFMSLGHPLFQRGVADVQLVHSPSKPGTISLQVEEYTELLVQNARLEERMKFMEEIVEERASTLQSILDMQKEGFAQMMELHVKNAKLEAQLAASKEHMELVTAMARMGAMVPPSPVAAANYDVSGVAALYPAPTVDFQSASGRTRPMPVPFASSVYGYPSTSNVTFSLEATPCACEAGNPSCAAAACHPQSYAPVEGQAPVAATAVSVPTSNPSASAQATVPASTAKPVDLPLGLKALKAKASSEAK